MSSPLQLANSHLSDMPKKYMFEMCTNILSCPFNSKPRWWNKWTTVVVIKTVAAAKGVVNIVKIITIKIATIIFIEKSLQTNRRNLATLRLHILDAAKEKTTNYSILRHIVPKIPPRTSKLWRRTEIKNLVDQAVYLGRLSHEINNNRINIKFIRANQKVIHWRF